MDPKPSFVIQILMTGALLEWIFAGDEPSLDAAELFVVLRLLASVVIDEKAVVSEVLTAILILDLIIMTGKKI